MTREYGEFVKLLEDTYRKRNKKPEGEIKENELANDIGINLTTLGRMKKMDPNVNKTPPQVKNIKLIIKYVSEGKNISIEDAAQELLAIDAFRDRYEDKIELGKIFDEAIESIKQENHDKSHEVGDECVPETESGYNTQVGDITENLGKLTTDEKRKDVESMENSDDELKWEECLQRIENFWRKINYEIAEEPEKILVSKIEYYRIKVRVRPNEDMEEIFYENGMAYETFCLLADKSNVENVLERLKSIMGGRKFAFIYYKDLSVRTRICDMIKKRKGTYVLMGVEEEIYQCKLSKELSKEGFMNLLKDDHEILKM